MYTEDGNWDLVGKQPPGLLHPRRDEVPGRCARRSSRTRVTNRQDANRIFDFVSPLALGDAHDQPGCFPPWGNPAGTIGTCVARACTPYKWVNARGEAVLVKYHWINPAGREEPDPGGRRNQPSGHQLQPRQPRDLYDGPHRAGQTTPAWELQVQIMGKTGEHPGA